MGKKHKQLPQNRPILVPAGAEPEGLSSRGKKVIGVGVGILIVGFIVLSRVDPMGRNWAGTLSPFLILGAYVIIGFGIFISDPVPSEPKKTT